MALTGQSFPRLSSESGVCVRQQVMYFDREADKFTNSMTPICDLKEKGSATVKRIKNPKMLQMTTWLKEKEKKTFLVRNPIFLKWNFKGKKPLYFQNITLQKQMSKWTPHDNFRIFIRMKKQNIFAHLINPCSLSCIRHAVKTACRRFVAAAVVMVAELAAVAGESAGNKGLPGILQIW